MTQVHFLTTKKDGAIVPRCYLSSANGITNLNNKNNNQSCIYQKFVVPLSSKNLYFIPMKRLLPILLACLCLTACKTQVTESAAENDSWQMTCDTVSLIGQIEVSLQPYFSVYSPLESGGNIYVTVNAGTCLSHYGYQLGGDYHFCITPDGQLSKTSKKPKTPREGFIPLVQTKEWDVNYVDVGEWGNYLSFTGKNSEYVFDQPGYLRALFIQDSAFLTVSQSTIARITNPTSGRLMTLPKTGGWEDEYLYHRNGAQTQEVLWTTDAFKIEWGDADTIIHGAFMVDNRLMLAMYINGNTGIYAFDGKDFQMEYDLGALSLRDNYSTLLNQLDHPNSLLLTFTDSNNRHGILHIKGRSIRLIYFRFPDRSLSVTQEDPTIPMIRSMLDLPTRTIAQIDSIEQVYGGVSMDEEQYYTLLSDSSYLWRSYSYNDSTGIVEDVQIERRNLNEHLYWEDCHEWQDAFVNAFWDELSPIESDNSNFIAYRSPRFHLQLSKYFHNNMIIFFDK